MTGLVAYAGYDLVHDNARFDPEKYGIGVATILGGSRLGRFLKKDTEHSGGISP